MFHDLLLKIIISQLQQKGKEKARVMHDNLRLRRSSTISLEPTLFKKSSKLAQTKPMKPIRFRMWNRIETLSANCKITASFKICHFPNTTSCQNQVHHMKKLSLIDAVSIKVSMTGSSSPWASQRNLPSIKLPVRCCAFWKIAQRILMTI